MSIKIWEAYKIKESSDLWPLARDIKAKASDNVRGVLRNIYADWSKDVNTDSPLFKKRLEHRDGNAELATLDVVHKLLQRGYRISSGSAFRSIFDFNVSVVFREYDGGIYLIPQADMLMRDTLSFLSEETRLVDFHYQNQTDKPKGIPQRQWNQREKVWDAIDASGWTYYLTLPICTYDSFWLIDPYFDLLKEYHERQKANEAK